MLDGEWRAAEGIGLTFGYSRQYTDNVGSGRVENYNLYLFRAAKVEVYGTTTKSTLFIYFFLIYLQIIYSLLIYLISTTRNYFYKL